MTGFLWYLGQYIAKPQVLRYDHFSRGHSEYIFIVASLELCVVIFEPATLVDL